MSPNEIPTSTPVLPRPFLGWLVLVYIALGVLIVGGGHLGDAVANWPIAVAMAIGSYIAGSTPMGGGTIGFPVLVLIFDEPATIGLEPDPNSSEQMRSLAAELEEDGQLTAAAEMYRASMAAGGPDADLVVCVKPVTAGNVAGFDTEYRSRYDSVAVEHDQPVDRPHELVLSRTPAHAPGYRQRVERRLDNAGQ